MPVSRKHQFLIAFSLVIFGSAVVALCYWRSTRVPDISQAVEDRQRLWMAALKGFEGPVYYVGEDEQYAYFRTRPRFFPQAFKAPAREMKVPTRFRLEEGVPYRVEQQMVPTYTPPGSTSSADRAEARGGE